MTKLGVWDIIYEESEEYMDILTKERDITLTKEQFGIRRENIKSHLSESVYGKIPEPPDHLFANIKTEDRGFAAGAAVMREFELIMTVDGKKITLPFKSVVPKENGKYPTFIYIGYDDNLPSRFLPAEEIVERGYALFCFSYKNVCENNGNFKSKLASHIAPSRKRKDSPGKIALWAWAISRVLDYAAHQEYVDKQCLAVVGQGLLARAALVAGGNDERFKYIFLGNLEFGENYISRPYLFCKSFHEKNDSIPDDLALSLCVPRNIIVCSATDDVFCDSEKEIEHLSSLNGYYELFGKLGLNKCKKPSDEPMTVSDGEIFYRLRSGTAYLSRGDWNACMDYIDAKTR